ncbi:MAG: hypothetical protein FJW31_20920 [Acidobacteria bacterium]|nr:hypothetical protein [Acidobacteriota bacterium]
MKALLVVSLALLLSPCVSGLLAAPPKAPADPRITSVHPLAVPAAVSTVVTVRGQGLAGARAMWCSVGSATARIEGAVATDGDAAEHVRVAIVAPAGFTGVLRLRLIASRGVSNDLPLHVVDAPVLDEPETVAIARGAPLAIAGRLVAKGEVDTVWLEAQRDDLLTFTAVSGVAGFDPALTLSEPSGSWFDAQRLNRLAFNDEPLHFPGLAQDARLVHRFDKAGRYALQVKAFSGQGGPDFTYLLRIGPGREETPLLHPPAVHAWDERRFTRRVGEAWMPGVAARGSGEAVKPPGVAMQGSEAEPKDAPLLTIPGLVEGRLTRPAQVHRVRVAVEKPQALAIEVETPAATMPRFNPVVRLLAPDDGGSEIVTNVYTKRNNNGLYMMKMIQAKSTVTLRSAGEYVLEVRDITTDVAGDDFAYRILVRPQMPHVGRVDVPEDRVNLEPGETRQVTVNIEREEDFKDLVLVSADGLPAGVTATAGMANPVERPPPPNGGRVERYVGKPQTATLLLTADENAKPGEWPSTVRVSIRTLRGGRTGAPILAKELPVLVIPRRPS